MFITNFNSKKFKEFEDLSERLYDKGLIEGYRIDVVYDEEGEVEPKMKSLHVKSDKCTQDDILEFLVVEQENDKTKEILINGLKVNKPEMCKKFGWI